MSRLDFDPIARACPEILEPAKDILDHNELFPQPNKVNIPLLQDHLTREGRVNISDIATIINLANAIFKAEPNVLTVNGEVRVCGDLHGSYYDFLKLIEVGGPVGENTYVFLGDYVDRGYFGCELLIHILSLKITFPNNIFMLRGNHESKHLTEHFNFKKECVYKYNTDVYNMFVTVFDSLPIAALIGERRFFCVHGGLSPQLKKIDNIASINRFREVPETGLIADLLWSDPAPTDKDPKGDLTFTDNTARSCSYYFGATSVRQFLRTNNLVAVVRGHECKDAGFEMQFPRSQTNPFPTVITLFSCPNYVDSFKNQAAILLVKKEKIHFRQFTASPHPYFLPNFIDVFHLSLPFVAENIASMLLEILRFVQEADELGKSPDQSGMMTAERRKELTNKIRSVGRLMKMFGTLRQEQESIVLLKGFCDGRIEKGLLMRGGDAIKSALSEFQRNMEMDKENLKRPPSSATSSSGDGKFIRIEDETQQRNYLRRASSGLKVKSSPSRSTSRSHGLSSSSSSSSVITEGQSLDIAPSFK